MVKQLIKTNNPPAILINPNKDSKSLERAKKNTPKLNP
jgi:hypothetical protein